MLRSYDLIEIGTPDFDTLVQGAGAGTVGLSIDAVPVCLDRLPGHAGCPEGYDPAAPPHGGSPEDAQRFCLAAGQGGVTHQFGRSEVREGRCLMPEKGNAELRSWVMLP